MHAQGHLELFEGGVSVTFLDQIFAAGPSCFSHIHLLLPPIFIQVHVFSVLSFVNAQMNLGRVQYLQVFKLQQEHDLRQTLSKPVVTQRSLERTDGTKKWTDIHVHTPPHPHTFFKA